MSTKRFHVLLQDLGVKFEYGLALLLMAKAATDYPASFVRPTTRAQVAPVVLAHVSSQPYQAVEPRHDGT